MLDPAAAVLGSRTVGKQAALVNLCSGLDTKVCTGLIWITSGCCSGYFFSGFFLQSAFSAMPCWPLFCSSLRALGPHSTNVCIKLHHFIHPWIPHSPAALHTKETWSFRYQQPSQIKRIHGGQWSRNHKKSPKLFLYQQQSLYYIANTWVLEKDVQIYVYTSREGLCQKKEVSGRLP